MATAEDLQHGVYVKGDSVRRCDTNASVVAARWEGYVLLENQDVESVDYRDLQAQAKALGVPANQSKEALEAAILEASKQPAGDQADETTPDQETE